MIFNIFLSRNLPFYLALYINNIFQCDLQEETKYNTGQTKIRRYLFILKT